MLKVYFMACILYCKIIIKRQSISQLINQSINQSINQDFNSG